MRKIALIGPKAVGKSLIAQRLSEKYPNHFLFSSDELENFCMLMLRGEFASVEHLKRCVIEEYAEEAKDFEKEGKTHLIKYNQAHIDKYLKMVDFFEANMQIGNLLKIMNDTCEILQKNRRLTLNQQLFILQYQKIKLIEEALKDLKTPILCDFGADVGCVIDLYKSEQLRVSEALEKPFSSLKNAQKRLFDKFGAVVYLEPGVDYKEKIDPRSGDELNKIYMKSPESYISFANFMVAMNGTFYNQKDEIFKDDRLVDFEVIRRKEALADKGNLDSIRDEIFIGIEGLGKMNAK